MPERGIRGQVYATAGPNGSVQARLTVEPTDLGDRHVRLGTWDADTGEHHEVHLDAETAERLGIDLQIRASYLRGVRARSTTTTEKEATRGQ